MPHQRSISVTKSGWQQWTCGAILCTPPREKMASKRSTQLLRPILYRLKQKKRLNFSVDFPLIKKTHARESKKRSRNCLYCFPSVHENIYPQLISVRS